MDQSEPVTGDCCLFLGSVTGDSLPISRIRYRRLVACFLDPLQETVACFSDPFTPENFSLISYFRAERGLKRNFQLVYDVQEGDIFHI